LRVVEERIEPAGNQLTRGGMFETSVDIPLIKGFAAAGIPVVVILVGNIDLLSGQADGAGL